MKYLLLCFILLGCGSQKPKEEPIIYSKDNPEVNTTNPEAPSITAKELAAELGSNLVTEIHYSKNSAKLNKKERKRLKKLYKEATNNQQIKSVQILSWSDKEYPTNKELEPVQESLAESRADKIEKFLATMDKNLTFKQINMAKPLNTATSLMNTEEAIIKKSIEVHDTYQDKASMSMVIFVPKKK